MRDFIESVILGSFGSAGLLALAGFIFKTRISHWLSRDLEKQKNQYARELEAYKVQLIAETEKIKAQQDVKKTGALWLLERKYKAITALIASVSLIFPDVYSRVWMGPDYKSQEDFSRLMDRGRAISSALSDCSGFLPIKDQQMVLAIVHKLNALMPHCQPGSVAYDLEENAQSVKEALSLEGDVNNILQAVLDDMARL